MLRVINHLTGEIKETTGPRQVRTLISAMQWGLRLTKGNDFVRRYIQVEGTDPRVADYLKSELVRKYQGGTR